MIRIAATHWRKWRKFVFVTCPECGVEASLDHDVAPDGKVSPSLDCQACDFHDFAILEGWVL